MAFLKGDWDSDYYALSGATTQGHTTTFLVILEFLIISLGLVSPYGARNHGKITTWANAD